MSGINVVGPGLAVAAIATMWASFAAAKIKAIRVSKQNTEQYGEGTVELLRGGSINQGMILILVLNPMELKEERRGASSLQSSIRGIQGSTVILFRTLSSPLTTVLLPPVIWPLMINLGALL